MIRIGATRHLSLDSKLVQRVNVASPAADYRQIILCQILCYSSATAMQQRSFTLDPGPCSLSVRLYKGHKCSMQFLGGQGRIPYSASYWQNGSCSMYQIQLENTAKLSLLLQNKRDGIWKNKH